MSFDQYILFIAITSVFLLSPGPSVMLAINNGIKYGVKCSSIAVLGNVIAFQLLIVLSHCCLIVDSIVKAVEKQHVQTCQVV